MKKCDTIYLITLAGSMDDLPVAVFDTRSGVDAFILSNRPCPVDGGDAAHGGPLANAHNVARYGPSIVFGYKVWEIKDGLPVRSFNRRWSDDQWPGVREWEAMDAAEREAFEKNVENEPWEPRPQPATGPQEEWAEAVPHEGDHLGGGPVG